MTERDAEFIFNIYASGFAIIAFVAAVVLFALAYHRGIK